MTISYTAPSDDQCFSRTPFRVLWWKSVPIGQESIAADQGRIAIACGHAHQQLVEAVPGYVIVPFLGQPTESFYKIQLVFETEDVNLETSVGLDVHFYDSDNGGHLSDAQVIPTIVINPTTTEDINGFFKLAMGSVQLTRTVLAGWYTHYIDPAMDLQRTLQIGYTSATKTVGGKSIPSQKVWLTGIYAVGFTDAAGGVFNV